MRILLAAGGTGGHLIPAIRIAEAIVRRRENAELMFVGSDRGFEERLVTARGYDYRGLPARGLSRRQWWRNFSAVIGNARAMAQSKTLIREFAPDVAVGCGGYASYFPIRACGKAGIPYVLQEQNSYPGLVTRWLAGGASMTFLAFAEAKKHIHKSKSFELVGNPIDPTLATCSREDARAAWSLSSDETVVLVTGGSGGARSINRNIVRGLTTDTPSQPVTILWQQGRQGAAWNGEHQPGWTVHDFEFTDRMTEAMVAADLIVSRSGALTVSEIAAAGKPAILIPFPHAAADHQTHNARSLSDSGGAVIVRDDELESRSLLQEALTLLSDSDQLTAMGAANSRRAEPEAADTIAQAVIALTEQAGR
jgi:UDP-N-acetylglucosamine--N-acetylmuramyl-(pentapeptide) pyrophosphoryl-undecaprenol N-acetylglucosamine transferase